MQYLALKSSTTNLTQDQNLGVHKNYPLAIIATLGLLYTLFQLHLPALRSSVLTASLFPNFRVEV